MKLAPIAWIAFALGCGAGGWILRGSQEIHNQKTTGDSVAMRGLFPEAHKLSPIGPTAATTSPQSPPELFRDTFKNPDPVVQMAVFLQALQGMTPENHPEFLAHWAVYLSQGRPPAGMDRMFNMRMGQVLGAAALSNRTGTPKDFKVLGSIKEQLAGAMQTDPDGVRVWFDGLHEEKFREAMLDGYVAGMANKDVAKALRYLGTLDPDLRQRSLGPVIGILRRNERPEELSAWFHQTAADPSLGNSPVLPELFDTTLRLALGVRQSVPTAAQLMEEHAGKSYVDPNKARDVARKYAQENLPDALAWASRMEASHPLPEKGTILLAAAGEVTGADISTAAEWCRDHVTGGLRSQALQQLAANAATTDPELAAKIQSWIGGSGR